jgi:hypothetical protein
MAESSVESKPVSQLKFGVERIRKDAIGRWREFNLSQKTKCEEDQIPSCCAGANGGIPVQAEGSLLAIPTQSENEQAEESNHHPEQFSIAAFAKPSPHHFSPQFCGQIVGRDRRSTAARPSVRWCLFVQMSVRVPIGWDSIDRWRKCKYHRRMFCHESEPFRRQWTDHHWKSSFAPCGTCEIAHLYRAMGICEC